MSRVRAALGTKLDREGPLGDAAALGGPGPIARSAVKHRPADFVAQPLVVKYEFANRLRKLVTLPPALKSPCGLALAFRRGSTCGLDRVGGGSKVVRGDVRNGPGLARSVGGMSGCSTQVSGRAHCMAAGRTSLGHRDLATHPSAGMLDRLTRSWVVWLSQLEKVKNVLCARCRPKSEEMVIRVGKGPTAANRHEARISDLRDDHVRTSITRTGIARRAGRRGSGRAVVPQGRRRRTS